MVINMECLSALRAMPSNSVDAVITDPPYDIKVTKGGSNIGKSLEGVNADLKGLDIVGGFDLAVLDAGDGRRIAISDYALR